ncbi:MAG TPA: hypothetical protein VMU37_09370 [Caulobacteraceae bacterium]|nr:hypothetical protein [Caulobacteraceae bacterium]
MSLSLRFAAGALAAAGAICAVLPAAEASPAGGACFRVDNIQNSKLDGPRTLYVRADGGRTFRIEFANDCDTAAAYSLILHPVSNTDQICNAIELNVRVRRTGEFCEPKSMTRLTPEEAAALPAKVRP